MERGFGGISTNIGRSIKITAVLLLVLTTLPVASADWQYQKLIEIDHNKVAADLADFPVLINLASDSDLAAHAQDDGDDIVFTNSANTVKFDHEIEYFNGTTGELVAWVRIPSLSSATNTTIVMRYGNLGCGSQENATGVWDDNYRLVQHLEETSGTHYDSTQYGNDGTKSGEVTQDATGMIDGADTFGGSADYVNCGNDTSLDITDAITISAWVKPGESDSYQTIVEKASYYDDAYALLVKKDIKYIKFSLIGIDQHWGYGPVDLWDGDWHYITGTYDKDGGSNNLRLYVDGSRVNDSTHTNPIASGAADDVFVGGHNYDGNDFNGTLDEVRISASARSGDWISTTYSNTHSPSTFYTVGDEQSAGPMPPVPDLPAIILFATGLALVAVYLVFVCAEEAKEGGVKKDERRYKN